MRTDSNALLNLISENFSEKNLDTFTYLKMTQILTSPKSQKINFEFKNMQNFSSYLSPNEIVDDFEKITKIITFHIN